MEGYQLRVVKEKRENDTKAKALSNFIGLSCVFETLDAAEQERIKVQCEIMWQLSEVLGERIKGFLMISDCGCRFESMESNTILLCEKCGELPCHTCEL